MCSGFRNKGVRLLYLHHWVESILVTLNPATKSSLTNLNVTFNGKTTLLILLTISSLFSSCQKNIYPNTNRNSIKYNYQHPIAFEPKSYVCLKTSTPMIIDGIVDSTEWSGHPWSDEFIDIEGDLKPLPPLGTRFKMAWDKDYLYIAAKMEEPHIWATLTNRDDIIYHDDDFEVFIDPDGDGHNYFEFEINAFNTVWDLLMLYPYGIDKERNYIMNWNIHSIQTAVHVEGTINDPIDIDNYWSCEIRIPWSTFNDIKKNHRRPHNGDMWRINFSRVDWPVQIENNRYIKIKDDNNKNLAENNWVWSPMGYINMHKPELWGYLYFSDKPEAAGITSAEQQIRWALWQLYYQLKECRRENDNCQLADLSIPALSIPDYKFVPSLYISPHQFTITASNVSGGIFVLNHRGKMTILENDQLLKK